MITRVSVYVDDYTYVCMLMLMRVRMCCVYVRECVCVFIKVHTSAFEWHDIYVSAIISDNVLR